MTYITPVLSIHTSFREAKQFFEEAQGIALFEDSRKITVPMVCQGKRNLIIGEPGVGKTLLLDKIVNYLAEHHLSKAYIELRNPDAATVIALTMESEHRPSALILDGLDEVPAKRFSELMTALEDVSRNHPELQIFISARWIFISRYRAAFAAYRYVAISPFTIGQVRDYLKAENIPDEQINVIHQRLSFGHDLLVIQIPRYLNYFATLVKEKKISTASEISRNDLFETFIYRKLDLEDEKLDRNNKDIIKRVLEKLALTMEIYQQNFLSNDELMTFFDELTSDLKSVLLSNVELDVFSEKSLLNRNPDSIEFDNTEFQEYLAAKEISRFSMPGRTVFGFAVEPAINEIYPSWFNTLTFLTDMNGDLLEQLIEFSGLRGKDKLVDETFFTFLSRLDPRKILPRLRPSIFKDVFSYHLRNLQWMRPELAELLADVSTPDSEAHLRQWLEEAEAQSNTKRFVPIGNVLSTLAAVLEKRAFTTDIGFWKSKLVSYASDKTENQVIQRDALFALARLSASDIIDLVPTRMGSEELIERAFLQMCMEQNPNHPKSVGYF